MNEKTIADAIDLIEQARNYRNLPDYEFDTPNYKGLTYEFIKGMTRYLWNGTDAMVKADDIESAHFDGLYGDIMTDDIIELCTDDESAIITLDLVKWYCNTDNIYKTSDGEYAVQYDGCGNELHFFGTLEEAEEACDEWHKENDGRVMWWS